MPDEPQRHEPEEPEEPEELEDPREAELRRMNDEETALQAVRDEGVDVVNVLIDYRELFRKDPLVALAVVNTIRQGKARTVDPVRDVSAYAKSVITGERTKLNMLHPPPRRRDDGPKRSDDGPKRRDDGRKRRDDGNDWVGRGGWRQRNRRR